jgi:hypothetical protein
LVSCAEAKSTVAVAAAPDEVPVVETPVVNEGLAVVMGATVSVGRVMTGTDSDVEGVASPEDDGRMVNVVSMGGRVSVGKAVSTSPLVEATVPDEAEGVPEPDSVPVPVAVPVPVPVVAASS